MDNKPIITILLLSLESLGVPTIKGTVVLNFSGNAARELGTSDKTLGIEKFGACFAENCFGTKEPIISSNLLVIDVEEGIGSENSVSFK